MTILKQLFHRAGFQYVYKTHNVAVDVSMWVFQTVPYPGLRCEVAHLVEFFLLKELVELFAVFEVHAHKAVVFVLRALYFGVPLFRLPGYAGFGEAGVFQVNVVVVVDVVYSYYGVASFNEAFGEVIADESRSACD